MLPDAEGTSYQSAIDEQIAVLEATREWREGGHSPAARYDASEALRELTALAPAAGWAVRSVLAETLQLELTQTYGDAAEKILHKPTSQQIAANAAQALANAAGAATLPPTAELSDDTIRALRTLAVAVRTAESQVTRVASLGGIAALCRVAPRRVADRLDSASLREPLVDLLPNIADPADKRALVRVWATLVVHSDGPQRPLLSELTLPAAREESAVALQTRGFTELLPAFADGGIDGSHDRLITVDGLTECPPDRWKPFAQALGEQLALQGAAPGKNGAQLLAAYRRMTGWDREATAQALGLAAALTEQPKGTATAVLMTDITSTTGPDRWHASRVLGEAIAAAPAGVPAVPDAVLTAVTEQRGRHRRIAARALGFRVARDEPRSMPLPERLADEISSATGQARRLQARTLGELVAGDPTVDIKVPAALREEVRTTDDWSHWQAARVLGEVAAAQLLPTGNVRASLITELTDQSGRDRQLALRTLGTIACLSDDSPQAVPQAIQDAVHRQSGSQRWLAARAAGELVVRDANGRPTRLEAVQRSLALDAGAEQHDLAETVGLLVYASSNDSETDALAFEQARVDAAQVRSLNSDALEQQRDVSVGRGRRLNRRFIIRHQPAPELAGSHLPTEPKRNTPSRAFDASGGCPYWSRASFNWSRIAASTAAGSVSFRTSTPAVVAPRTGSPPHCGQAGGLWNCRTVVPQPAHSNSSSPVTMKRSEPHDPSECGHSVDTNPQSKHST